MINYREEDVLARLKQLPRLDVVYESVGGKMFEAAVRCLAPGGRLVVIGMMSQYTAGPEGAWALSSSPGLAERLLNKSAAVVGLFVPHHAKHFKRHLARLLQLHAQGKLRVLVDPSHTRRPPGIGGVVDAVRHLQSGNSIGKVVVQMHPRVEQQSRL